VKPGFGVATFYVQMPLGFLMYNMFLFTFLQLSLIVDSVFESSLLETLTRWSHFRGYWSPMASVRFVTKLELLIFGIHVCFRLRL